MFLSLSLLSLSLSLSHTRFQRSLCAELCASDFPAFTILHGFYVRTREEALCHQEFTGDERRGFWSSFFIAAVIQDIARGAWECDSPIGSADSPGNVEGDSAGDAPMLGKKPTDISRDHLLRGRSFRFLNFTWERFSSHWRDELVRNSLEILWNSRSFRFWGNCWAVKRSSLVRRFVTTPTPLFTTIIFTTIFIIFFTTIIIIF